VRVREHLLECATAHFKANVVSLTGKIIFCYQNYKSCEITLFHILITIVERKHANIYLQSCMELLYVHTGPWTSKQSVISVHCFLWTWICEVGVYHGIWITLNNGRFFIFKMAPRKCHYRPVRVQVFSNIKPSEFPKWTLIRITIVICRPETFPLIWFILLQTVCLQTFLKKLRQCLLSCSGIASALLGYLCYLLGI
jgi:hypothetical protein